MPVETGIIESVTTKDGKAGNRPWTRTAARINENFYQTFDQTLGKQIVALEGEFVNVEYEERERNGYVNLEIMAVKRSKTPPEAPVSDSNSLEPLGGTLSSKDSQIARSVALKAAVKAVPSLEENTNLKVYAERVGTVADMFYGWLVNNPTAEEAKQEEIDLELDSEGLPKGF